MLMTTVIQAMCDEFDVRLTHMMGPRRTQPLASIRQLCYLACYEVCDDKKLSDIAYKFNRDAGSIDYGMIRARQILQENPNYAAKYHSVVDALLAVNQPNNVVQLADVRNLRSAPGV